MFFFLFSAKNGFFLVFYCYSCTLQDFICIIFKAASSAPLIYIILRCKPFRGCTGASSFFKGASRSASPLKMLAPCFKASSSCRNARASARASRCFKAARSAPLHPCKGLQGMLEHLLGLHLHPCKHIASPAPVQGLQPGQ